MGPQRFVKKVARSVLVRTPRVYDLLTAQPRYLALYALGRVHEPGFRLFPQLVSTDAPLILDVGGNLGQSILSIMTVLPKSTVVSFEPNPVLQPSLDRMRAKFPHVTVERCGLAARDGLADLYWPVYNGRSMLGLASFDHGAAEHWLGPETVYGFHPDRLEVQHAQLTLRRLDTFGLAPHLIKIDVQGLESEVIRGGLATIGRARPVIMAEDLDQDSEAVELLRPLGYRLWTQPARSNSFLLPDEVSTPAA